MELPPRLWKKDTHLHVTANLPPQKEGPQLIIMIIRKRETEAKKARAHDRSRKYCDPQDSPKVSFLRQIPYLFYFGVKHCGKKKTIQKRGSCSSV